ERRCTPRSPKSTRARGGALHRSLLAQRLVQYDGDRGREVQAPHVLARDGDAEERVRVRVPDRGWQPAALPAEDEEVAVTVGDGRVRARRACREAEEAARRTARLERRPLGMAVDVHVRPVVEPGAADMPVIDRE